MMKTKLTRSKLVILLIVGCVVLNLAVQGALGWAILQSRLRYEKSAQTNVSNLSKVLEENVYSLIREIDLTLLTIADEKSQMGVSNRLDHTSYLQFLQKHTSRVASIMGLRVADEAGNIIYATGEAIAQRVNIGDREHFLRVKAEPDPGLVITGPILGRVSNKWILVFSRRITRPDGSFGGEVHASVKVDTINRIFSAVDMGPRGVVSMWDKTTTLARYPENVGGRNVIGIQQPSRELKALLDSEVTAAFYTATAPTDNVKKSYSIRRVGQFPLWVISGVAEDDYLKPWRTETLKALIAAAVFAIVTIIFSWYIYRYWRAENLIRERENQLNSVQSLAHIGSWIRDLSTGKHVWSDEVFRILGYLPQSFAPEDELLLEAVHADDRKEVIAMINGQTQDNGNRAIRFRIIQPDGSVRWIRGEGWTEVSESEGPDRVKGFIRDITESKRAEEEKAELERMLRTDRLEGLGALAAGLAHDFNNLLQGVFGYVSLAKLRFEKKEESLAMLDQAEQALQRTISLSNQLLTFSKGGNPVKTCFDARGVIENTVKFGLSGSKSGYRIDIDADLWCIEADEGQIAQVIQNLVINADQAMPTGGMVMVSARNAEAPGEDVPLELKQGKYIAISIRDEGPGIREDVIRKIFDPYFTTKERGYGLGLATSYSIVATHGGIIDVESQIGKGSRFTVYLPADDRPITDIRQRPADSIDRRAKVLVMDDDEVVSHIAQELLTALGHQVEHAWHGEEARLKYLQAVESGSPFDVVILDLTIRGGVGGIDTLKMLKEVSPDVKAIVSSGYSEDNALSEYQKYGFVAVLKKPYTLEALKETLNEVLQLPI